MEANLQDQDPWESKNAWHDTAQAIMAGDGAAVPAAKSKIEIGQRKLRIQEREGQDVAAKIL